MIGCQLAAQGQRPAPYRGHAGVGIGSRKGQRTRAGLGQAGVAVVDAPSEVAALDSEAVGVEDLAAAVEATHGASLVVAVIDGAGGDAQIRAAGDVALQGSGVDSGPARVGVVSGEGERARAGLDQAGVAVVDDAAKRAALDGEAVGVEDVAAAVEATHGTSLVVAVIDGAVGDAQIRAAGDVALQGSFADGGAARVGVGPGKG